MSMPQLQNLGLSGYAWVGVDVGGFSGDATGELLARWTEFGIFQPFCRNHSAWNTRPQEPWAFGEPYESQIRSMLLLRQRLIPYLYTLFEEAHRTGAPILRPLLFEYPEDAATYATDDEFLVGRALLVAPIARPGAEYRHVYLPRGTWLHYWSGEHFRGPTHVLARAPLGQPAIYVRANTPIPLWPEMAYDGEHPADPLTWLVFTAAAEDGSAELYEDDGDGYGYERGIYARTHVRCSASADVEVTFDAVEGAFASPSRSIEVELRGLQRPAQVLLDGAATQAWDYADGRLTVRLPRAREPRRLLVRAGAA
jgi:alpha-glucosidase